MPMKRFELLQEAGIIKDDKRPEDVHLPNTMSVSRKFVILGVMAFGQFMALLDIQIVAASMNDIQAGLSAGPDEISWVQTAYLMAELVMIPFSGFLALALSTRWLFALSAGLFTLFSALCGLAWDIQSIVLFRALQGFTGGAMVPTVYATGFTLFTGRKRAIIPPVLAVVATLAPTLGPTVGGWITDILGWRWIFYINVLPGIAIAASSFMLVRIDRPRLAMLRSIDYAHLAAMAIWLGCLQYVLEEGPRHDWFSDPDIARASWISFVAFLLFLERSFLSTAPIVSLAPFRHRTFTLACVFNLIIGFGLYAAIYLVPLFLGRVRGFSSVQIGTTVFVVGIAMICGAPVVSALYRRVDPRLIITAGFVLYGIALWMLSAMGPEWGFWELFWPHALRGFSILLCIAPAVDMALAGFTRGELSYASGLFNLTRNLGGAIGIAVANTWLQDFTRIHALRLNEALGQGTRVASEFISAIRDGIASISNDAHHALQLAQGELWKELNRQAQTQAFGDVFLLMAWIFGAALILVPFCSVSPKSLQAEPSLPSKNRMNGLWARGNPLKTFTPTPQQNESGNV
jgi:DHA2 family multidrug resistance protein